MPFLIDGHNLIGQMPGLSLDDPDDELKLVQQLKRYCARARRTATVIFDRGLLGGRSRELSGGGLTVVFAAGKTDADALLVRRIEAERNPKGLIVVTSDQKVAAAARQRRMTVKASAEFANLLSKLLKAGRGDMQNLLSEPEISEWEALFGARTDQD